MARRTPLADLDPDRGVIAHYGAEGVLRWSHRELWAAVDGYRDLLSARSREGDLVLVVSGTRPEAMALFLAGMTLGRIVSFFPPQHPIQDAPYFAKQQQIALERVAPDLLVVTEASARADLLKISPQLAPRVASAAVPAPQGDWRRALTAFCARVAGEVGGDRPLFVQHSSGTTGIKKACAIHAALLRGQFDAYWRDTVCARLAPEPRVASWLPLYHDMGLVAAFLLPILGGAPIATLDTFDWVAQPQRLLDIVEAERASLCWMPNFAFRHYVRLHRFLTPRDLSSVKAWIDCSETCRSVDAQAFEDKFADWGVPAGAVLGCYAMAETVFAATQAMSGPRRTLAAPPSAAPGETIPASLVTVGRVAASPTPGVKLVLSSGSPVSGASVEAYVGGEPAPPGVYGELGIRAPFNFHGYRGRTAAESGFLPDGTFMTGDLGVVLDGDVFVFGRTKEIIIVAGKNLHAGDLESAASTVAGVKPGRVVAFGLENVTTGTDDLVLVAERDGSDVAPDTLRAELTKLIQGMFAVMPRDVLIVDTRWLVKSTSGKISRQANREKYEAHLRGETAAAPTQADAP